MTRNKKIDLVIPIRGKLIVDSIVPGNRNQDRLLPHKLLRILIERWKSRKLFNVCMARRLKDCHIGMDAGDRWWVMGRVGGGEAGK